MSSDRRPEGTAEGGECPVCDGARWLSVRAPVGSPEFGRLVPCECLLRAHAQRRVERLNEYSELGALRPLTFESLAPQGREGAADPASFRKANEVAKTYAAAPAGWLVLSGPSGVGKTHLAAAVVNFAVSQGRAAKFVFVPEFLDRLRASFSDSGAARPGYAAFGYGQADQPPAQGYDEMLALAASAPLLALDDLGGQSSTPWAEEKLRQVLAYRWDRRAPTVVTTRLAPEGMDDWLKSRLADPATSRLLQIKAGAVNADLTDVGIELRMRQAMTFDSFDPVGSAGASAEQRERLREALAAAQAFAADPHGWLYLAGPTGVGKTHLAVAIAAARLERKQPVLFRFVPDLLDHLRRTFGPDSSTSYDRLFERTRNAELLILDDFGAQSWTAWTEEKMYQLIVHRHNANLPTVITSRVLLDDMDGPAAADQKFGRRFSDAIASRLRDGSVVMERLMSAPDYRNRGGQGTARTPKAKAGVRAQSRG
jgi:DNA replication protein DnaC